MLHQAAGQQNTVQNNNAIGGSGGGGGGGNRSLPYYTLLGVLWQMYNAWITHGIVSGAVLVTDRLRYTRGK